MSTSEAFNNGLLSGERLLRSAAASVVMLALFASTAAWAGDLPSRDHRPAAIPASRPMLSEDEQSVINSDIAVAMRALQYADYWACDVVDQGRVDAQHRRLFAALEAFRERGGKITSAQLLIIDGDGGCRRSSNHLDEELNSAGLAISHMRRILNLPH